MSNQIKKDRISKFILGFAIIGYLPPLIVWSLFFINRKDMGYYPQYALFWAFAWSTLVLIWGKYKKTSGQRKIAKVGFYMANFSIALFIAIILVFVTIRLIIEFSRFLGVNFLM